MEYLYIKALHIIFIVTWFAGLFYIVRLFIYHAEAETKEEPAKSILQTQYKLMSKRLWYIITWPSAVLASFFAFWLLSLNPALLSNTWMWVKLSFVFLLYLYQLGCHVIFKQLQNDIVKYSSTKLRLWNEVATVILFAVVFIIELQNSLNWIWGVLGIIAFGITMMVLVKLYKKSRKKRSWDKSENKK